ncbi:MAG: acyl carrier protein [Candidatus Petromonas sp.]|jgi:acyl carrier protein|nr:acyl carrier protein [Candidatus Petromonas sp.]
MLEQSVIGLKNKGGILMVLDKVKEIIIEQLGLDEDVEITMETSLMNDLEADSLDAVEVIMAIEDEFDIEIPDEDAEDFKNIGDIVKYVEDRI